jgi:chemotaxis signal transduction protein
VPSHAREADSSPAAAAHALLRSRAERYAAASVEDTRVLFTAVTFRRGESAYALPLTGLCEIRPLARWCALPGTNPAVLGMVYYRGELLSLHDLATFASGTAPAANPAWILVAEHRGARIGLVADDVMEVLELEVGSAHAVPVTLGDAADVFAGMTERGVLIVDVLRMFQTARFTNAF